MPEKEKEKMTIVVFSGDLDKALAAFILATTGASMGMDVSMFFTFWGLNIIKSNEGGMTGKGFKQKMFSLLNKGGTNRLKLSKFHMLGLGTWMMKLVMKDSRYPSIEEFITIAKDMGVKLIPCSTTCGMFGLTENSFRSGVESIAGAAYFLNEARQSKVSLFI
ncbi:MAG TPA: DsrE/DsrF/DrsH-like family protein [Dehalococcoidales bacterium]|nr:DsrE/DsrF/DrsH-like family protein [Dehalococcoidales bacterium]